MIKELLKNCRRMYHPKAMLPTIFLLGALALSIIINGCKRVYPSIEKVGGFTQPRAVTGLNPDGSSLSHIPNPERGFRYEAMAKIPSLSFPWNASQKLNINNWLTSKESYYVATDGHIRVSQLYLYLTDYANTDVLPQAALDTVAAVLNGVRAQGYKLVLRFAYTYDGTGGYVYPPMTRILSHLTQLTPVLQNNADVIHVLQSGIIGLWGEWHNYNNAYTSQDKTNLISKLLQILPDNRNTMVRMPSYKNALTLTTAEKGRIGFYNDFFTDDQHSKAYTDGYLSTTIYNQVSTESKTAMVDGEMPYEGTTTWHLTYALNPIKSIKQLRDHHYSTFSVAHNYPITINGTNGWKTTPITKAQLDANGFPYDPAYFKGPSRSVYDYVADYLGYRLWMDYGSSSVIDNGTQIQCSIAIRNYGFSAIQNPREVYLVLLKSDGTVANSIKLTNKPSDWHTGVAQTLSATFQKPVNLGNYKIGIWMPDYATSPSRLDARYAMRFCNMNWETRAISGGNMGINVVDMNSVSNYCPAPGDDVSPADRYIQSLSTTGATQNISYSASSFPIAGYMKYGTQEIQVQKGTSFTLNFNNSPNTKWNRVIAWVDWNKNGVFEDTAERVFYVGNASVDNSATVLAISRSIAAPASAVTGVVGMRIRFHDAWLPTIGTCGYQDNSSTFDFSIKVL